MNATATIQRVDGDWRILAPGVYGLGYATPEAAAVELRRAGWKPTALSVGSGEDGLATIWTKSIDDVLFADFRDALKRHQEATAAVTSALDRRRAAVQGAVSPWSASQTAEYVAACRALEGLHDEEAAARAALDACRLRLSLPQAA